MILTREPIPWQKGMNMLKNVKETSQRKQIVKSMQQHKDFQAEVQSYRTKAEKKRRGK